MLHQQALGARRAHECVEGHSVGEPHPGIACDARRVVQGPQARFAGPVPRKKRKMGKVEKEKGKKEKNIQ